jgi:hypothetical protein
MLSLVGAEMAHAAPERVRVVVGVEPGKARAVERLVRRLGGDVGERLPIVDGFTARVPAASIARLRRSGSVRTVARDVALTLSTATPVEEQPAAHAIDPPPDEIPTDEPADEVARDVIADAADDAAAGSSLAPDPSRAARTPSARSRTRSPTRSRRSSRRPTTARRAPAPRWT